MSLIEQIEREIFEEQGTERALDVIAHQRGIDRQVLGKAWRDYMEAKVELIKLEYPGLHELMEEDGKS